MAIVLPLVLLLACACVDFGRVIQAYLAVSNAARSGAEYGAMHGFTPYTRSAWETQIRRAIEDELQSLPGFSAANIEETLTTDTEPTDCFACGWKWRTRFKPR
jgi:Flp pilus assembly protein TadG